MSIHGQITVRMMTCFFYDLGKKWEENWQSKRYIFLKGVIFYEEDRYATYLWLYCYVFAVAYLHVL